MAEPRPPLEAEYIYDLELWRSRYETFLASGGTKIGASSPMSIAALETERGRNPQQYDEASAVPTDLFAFALEAPARPDVTKLGGVPWRAAGLPWPNCWRGWPMKFLFQVRLAESKDVTGETPGDVLLLFGDSPLFEDVQVEWSPIDLPSPMTAEEVPPYRVDRDYALGNPTWEFVQAYGIRHRSKHYPQSKIAHRIATAPLQVSRPIPDLDPPSAAWSLTLNSVSAKQGVPFPWSNVEAPWTFEERMRNSNKFMIWDGAMLNLQFGRNGLLEWQVIH